MRECLEFDWKAIGAKLINLTDREQKDFFEGFAIELDSWESHLLKESQMMAINFKLKKQYKKILQKYLPAIWYDDEE